MSAEIPSNIFKPYNIQVVTGGVGDEKYLEAVRIVQKTKFAGSKYQIFTHIEEPRGKDSLFEIKKQTHDGFIVTKIKIEQLSKSAEIIEKMKPETTTVGILAAHLFDMSLVDVVLRLRNEGKFVVVAGVDKTFEADPFGPMGYIMIDSSSITKKYDKCKYCSNVATRTQKIKDGKPEPWGSEIKDKNATYENVCLNHYHCENSPQEKLISKYRGSSNRIGNLIVCYGTMGSGKSEAMITKILEESKKKGKKYQFTTCVDERCRGKVVSRTEFDTGQFGIEFPATEINDSNMWQFVDEAKQWPDKRIVAVDEIPHIKNVTVFVNALRLLGHDVIAAGLVKDFKKELFGEGDYLLAEADEAEFTEAICDTEGCNNNAFDLIRLVGGKPAEYTSPVIVFGSDGKARTNIVYQARCIFHHEIPGKPEYIERKVRRRQ